MFKYKPFFGGRHFPPGTYNGVKIAKAKPDGKGNMTITFDFTNAKPVDPVWSESYGDLYAKRHPAANRSSDLYELNKAAWPQVNLSNFATPPPIMAGAPGRKCATEVRAHINAMEAAQAFDSTWMEMMKALGATKHTVSNRDLARFYTPDYAITTAKIKNSATSGFDSTDYTVPPAQILGYSANTRNGGTIYGTRFVGPVQPSPGLWSRVWRAINRFAFRDS